MSRLIRSLAVAALSVSLLLTAAALPALARTRTATTTGNDISWPQCGKSYPTGQAFGIVGLNGGLANDLNGCLSKELAWAATSSGTSAPGAVPKAMLYVNTADPGQVVPTVADWPSSNTDPNGVTVEDPYGPCAKTAQGTGADDQACAWQYGWDRAIQDMLWLAATSARGASNVPSAYWWWLDVETGNSWETGTTGLASNVADLEGMVAAFKSANETAKSGVPIGGVTTVGIYSTSYQWGQITGSAIPAGSALVGLPDWIPGAGTTTGAQADCSLPTFTGGSVLMTQWFGKPFDGDYACQV